MMEEFLLCRQCYNRFRSTYKGRKPVCSSCYKKKDELNNDNKSDKEKLEEKYGRLLMMRKEIQNSTTCM